MGKTAVLIDGGFYRRRAQSVMGDEPAKDAAERLARYCYEHVNKQEGQSLYRVFYYDCPPMDMKLYHPLLKVQKDFSKTELYSWMVIFLDELREKRKFALRLGSLAVKQAHFNLREKPLKKLCNGRIKFEDLEERDFEIDVKQKGVDIMIGVDISSMAYKKQIDQIILISGDSDFVPAAKIARREGIDFILDPMKSPIKPDLKEHIDGLQTVSLKKCISK